MAKSSGTNDALQIVMMTLFLMAIFFAGWGAYNHFFRVQDEREARAREQQGLVRLQTLLKEDKNKEAKIQWQRRRESGQQGSEGLDSDVMEILRAMPGKSPDVIKDIDPQPAKVSDGYKRLECRVSFEPMALDAGLLQFVQTMETMKPHIFFERVYLNKKKGRNKDENNWQSEFVLVTYVSADE